MKALSDKIVEALVGDTWTVCAQVADGAVVTSTVTTPGGQVTHPEPTVDGATASLDVTVSSTGRYVVQLVTAGAQVPFVAYVSDVTTGTGMPALASVKAYLSSQGETSQEDATITEALNAEAANQRAVCDVGPVYGPDLAEALKRRVARNLAARAVPVAQITSFDGAQVSTRVTRYDAEVERFEAPYRKVVVA